MKPRRRLHPSAAMGADVTQHATVTGEQARFLQTFREDVISGLLGNPKTLPCKYLYDEAGCELFDRICELPEYYPTRTEIGIFRRHLPEIAELCGPRVQVVEYGSGSGLKTLLFLGALDRPAGCALVELSNSYLAHSVVELQREFPQLKLDPVCADYTQPIELPDPPAGTSRRVAFFPGSTIGNFDPADAVDFLVQVRDTVGRDGAMIIGVDLQKEESILCPAYDDHAGVTAAFNRNLLVRINRELSIDISPDDFYHAAPYNRRLGRVEMHLVARRDLVIPAGEEMVYFEQGESIHTENSYKHTLEGFAMLAEDAGWKVEQVWTDERKLFSVQFMTVV